MTNSLMTGRRYEVVLFDLLTALLDSWKLGAEVARDPGAARRWRERYLALTFSAGRHAPYKSLVARAAAMEGLDSALARRLTQAYGRLGGTFGSTATRGPIRPRARPAQRTCTCSDRRRAILTGAKIWPVPVTCGDRRCVAVGDDGQPCPSACST